MCAFRRKACRRGRRSSERKPSCFSPSSSRAARCIRARWRNTLRTGAFGITGADRQTPPRRCSTRSTIAAWCAWCGGGLVLARRREPTTCGHSGDGAIADPVRSDRARPHPFRNVVELDLPFRSIHTGAETEARLLRVAAPVARSRHRLDESDGEKWCAARRSRLRAQPVTNGSCFPARARCRAGPDTILPWTSYLTFFL